MDAIVWTMLGTIAAILTSFGFVPQVMKMWRRRSVGDVSKETFFQFTAGVSLWAIYGLSRGDLVLIIANLLTLATLVIGLGLFYRFRTIRAKEIALIQNKKKFTQLPLDSSKLKETK